MAHLCRLSIQPTPPIPTPLPPQRLELQQDRKWVVEHYSANREIVIEGTDPKHTVYIFNCHNSVVQVCGAAGGGDDGSVICACRRAERFGAHSPCWQARGGVKACAANL